MNLVEKIEALKKRNLHLVEVVDVDDRGFIRVLDKNCQGRYAVPYSYIENYKGEYSNELKQFSARGLRKGLQIWIEFENENIIKAIYPYEKFEILRGK